MLSVTMIQDDEVDMTVPGISDGKGMAGGGKPGLEQPYGDGKPAAPEQQQVY